MGLHRVVVRLADAARIAGRDRPEEGAGEVALAIAGLSGELLAAIGGYPRAAVPRELRLAARRDDRESGARRDAGLQRVRAGIAADRAVRPLDGERVAIPVLPVLLAVQH